MDWTSIIVAGVTGALSITAVGVAVSKFSSNSAKYILLAKDAVTALSDLANSLKDGALTADEVEQLKADIAKFQADLKG